MARVLVVDDDRSHAKQLAIALQLEGIDATTAASAAEAVEALSADPTDLVLLELMLPGTNGLELARSLHTQFPDVRIVLTGAYHLSERQLVRSNCGALGFVPKPCKPATVAEFVRGKVPASPPSSARIPFPR